MNKRALFTVVIFGCVVSCVVGNTCPAAKAVSGDDFRFGFVEKDVGAYSYFYTAPERKGDNIFQSNPFGSFLSLFELANNEPFIPIGIKLRLENAKALLISGYPHNKLDSFNIPQAIENPPGRYCGLPDELKGVALNSLMFGCKSIHSETPCTLTVINVRGCRGDWCRHTNLSLSDFIYNPSSGLAPPVKGNNTYQTLKMGGSLVFHYRLPNETPFIVTDIELHLEHVSDLYIARIFHDGSVDTEKTHSPGQVYDEFPATLPRKPLKFLHIQADTDLANVATVTVKKLTALQMCSSDM